MFTCQYCFLYNIKYTTGDSLKQPSGKLKYLPSPNSCSNLEYNIPRRHIDSQVQKSTLISHPPSKTDVAAQIDGSMSQKLYASSELRHVYVK